MPENFNHHSSFFRKYLKSQHSYETIWKPYLEHDKIVSLNNIYINESHWLYTWQIYTVSKSGVEISHRVMEIFSVLKRLEWQFDPSCGFFENAPAKEIVNSWFFVTFTISQIIPENFIEIPQVTQKIWRLSLTILAIFINFYQFFGVFDISLWQKN